MISAIFSSDKILYIKTDELLKSGKIFSAKKKMHEENLRWFEELMASFQKYIVYFK